MKNKNIVTVRNSSELAKALNLSEIDIAEMNLRARLNLKIAEVVSRQKLTHLEVARKAKTSRTKITAILNGNTKGISTDLLLRVLYSLGYKAHVTFSPVKIAA